MAKQGCPDPIKGSDPVTTQLWLGRGTSATHPPMARLEPKCLESIGLINLEKGAGGQIGKSHIYNIFITYL